MRSLSITAALLLASCGGGGSSPDTNWLDQTDPADGLDGPGDTPSDDAGDADSDPTVSGAGTFVKYLPTASAPGAGVIMRVSHPAEPDARFPEGAPVVVMAQGGHGPGEIGWDEVNPLALEAGVVTVVFILPGGGRAWPASTGTFDYRGPACRQALRDVIRYAMGELEDEDGLHISDRIPWADTGMTGLLGMSNGGNLALVTIGEHGPAIAGLDWLALWESPIGDQYVNAELGKAGGPENPFYVPGTCTATACPWPGFDVALEWDTGFTREIVDPLDGTMWPITGTFFVDFDADGTLDGGELVIEGIPGPGEIMSGEHLPWLYYSTELADAIDGRMSDLFPVGLPSWMASTADMRSYWSGRDGALSIAAASAALPGLPVMILGSVEDHVQGPVDHPHLRSLVMGLAAAGHAWFRVDPDSVYMEAASGEPAASFPELAAGEQIPWPGASEVLIPEALESHLVPAAVMELCDRARAGNTDPDLDAVLY